MTTRRQFLTIAGGVAGLAGAGGIAVAGVFAAPKNETAPTGVSDLLLVDTDRGLAVVRGTVSRVVGVAAAPTPDAKAAYVAEPNGANATSLAVVDMASGAVRGSISLAGWWVPRTVSANGTLVALTAAGGAAHLSRPPGRADTTIVVAGGNGQRHRLTLAGNYEPDAFSRDGSRLFVLEWLPATAPEHYRVRVVDLASGEIGPLLTRDKSPVPAGAEEEMRGEGRQAAYSPDRRSLYTLYTHQPDHQHTRDLLARGRRADVHAFVHVLDLEIGWAYCLDLPDPFGNGPAEGHTLAVSPDGKRLFVADLGSGRLGVADTESLTVQQVVAVPNATGTAYSAASPDGRSLYLGGDSRVHVVDLATLAVTAGWDADGPVRGLAVGPDGSRLYVGRPGAVDWRSPATGAPLGRQRVPGLTGLRQVVAGSAQR